MDQGHSHVMAARFSSRCVDCGEWISKGDLFRYDGKGHHYEACPTIVKANEPVYVPSTLPEPREPREPREGTYTVVSRTDRRTFRVRRQPLDRNFMPGRLIVSYLAGPDNEVDYVRFAHVSDGQLRVWKRFSSESDLVAMAKTLLDPEGAKAAGLAYAMESGNCYVCGRKLTVPASVCAGIGPVCARR